MPAKVIAGERQSCRSCLYVQQQPVPTAVMPASVDGVVCCFSPPALVPGGPDADDRYVASFVPVTVDTWCGRWESRDRSQALDVAC